MVKCPTCTYASNPDEALKCEKCGVILPETRHSLLRSPLKQTGLLSPASLHTEAKVREQHVGKLARTDLALYVADVEEPLIVPLTRDLWLGRYGGTDVETPAQIDLAPFGALESGVSRKHAVLRRLGPDVVIIDMGSTNGTWLNGVPLRPNQPVTLRSGDRVLLARLLLQVYLPEPVTA
jgi:hypothetical protein